MNIDQQEQNDELMNMAGAFTQCLMDVHEIPADFDGLSFNVLRCPDTFSLMAIVITPVDKGKDGEPKVRYNVDPGKLRRADMPKIVLAS